MRQFKVAGTKFWPGLTQVNQRRLKLCSSQLAITGYKRCSIILGGKYQFVVEGSARHLAGDVTAGDQALRGRIEGHGRRYPGQTDNRGYEQQKP